MNQVQPFLRWAGSKRQLLPILSDYWDDSYDRYVEPFAGSACFFFRLNPGRAVLGDINQDLISTYEEIKCRVDEVVACLLTMNKGRTEYLELREKDVSKLTPSQRAARFIYLNRFCFNGLYRTNLSGHFNVPYGGDKAGNIPNEAMLRACSTALRNVELIPGDFERVLAMVEPGDFVYMDPPFSTKTRRVFREYDPAAFATTDLERLRRWMGQLAERGIPFLISYAECEEAELLREGFHWRTVTVKRNIAGFATSRGESNEVLISNRLMSDNRELRR